MKLLIIDVNPFGALTDVVKWVQYLPKDWSIKVLCFAPKHGERAEVEGITVKEVYNYGNRQVKAIYFFLHCFWHLLLHRGKVMVIYFPHCELLKRLFPWKKMLLDIRTLSVNKDLSVRNKHNAAVRRACLVFDKVSAISEGVAKQLGNIDVNILPLGADTISSTKKDYSNGIRLLYVGIFSNRNIEETIKGVVEFHNTFPHIPICYKIIGYGTSLEEESMKNLIQSCNADNFIKFIGRVPHHLLSSYFDESNVGISFVPITDYFEHQPPTKTFEYCISGLFCLATGTMANKDIITSDCGIIINDTAQDVKEGLIKYWSIRTTINETAVRSALESSKWQVIVETHLIPIISTL